MELVTLAGYHWLLGEEVAGLDAEVFVKVEMLTHGVVNGDLNRALVRRRQGQPLFVFQFVVGLD